MIVQGSIQFLITLSIFISKNNKIDKCLGFCVRNFFSQKVSKNVRKVSKLDIFGYFF